MATDKQIETASDKYQLFPNGFVSYRETLVLMTLNIGIAMNDLFSGELSFPFNQLKNGQNDIPQLAHRWTIEFEELNRGRVWDGEWRDELDKFYEDKISQLKTT